MPARRLTISAWPSARPAPLEAAEKRPGLTARTTKSSFAIVSAPRLATRCASPTGRFGTRNRSLVGSTANSAARIVTSSEPSISIVIPPNSICGSPAGAVAVASPNSPSTMAMEFGATGTSLVRLAAENTLDPPAPPWARRPPARKRASPRRVASLDMCACIRFTAVSTGRWYQLSDSRPARRTGQDPWVVSGLRHHTMD